MFLFGILEIQSKDVMRKDYFGRNYLQRDRGEIQFLLDKDYRESVPHFSQIHIHEAEWKALVEARRFLPALSLLRAMKYCGEKEIHSEAKKWNKQLSEWTGQINFISSKYSDLLELDRKWVDPYLCIKKEREGDFYNLGSSDYKLNIKIPYNYRYSYPKIKSYQKEEVYEWTSLVFSERIQDLDDIELNDLEFWLKVLSKEKPIPFSRWKRLYIFLFNHKAEILNERIVMDFWDRKRGLTPQNLETYQFQRNADESRFEVLDKNGKRESFICKEKIIVHGKRAVGLFLVSPLSEIETVQRDWKKIIE